jgi:hypothetical protein
LSGNGLGDYRRAMGTNGKGLVSKLLVMRASTAFVDAII